MSESPDNHTATPRVNRLIAEAFAQAAEQDPNVLQRLFRGLRKLVEDGSVKDSHPYQEPKP